MDVDEEDDFYATEETEQEQSEHQQAATDPSSAKSAPEDEGLEEGEEEDEEESGDGSDSELEIITERKDGSKAAPPSQPRYNDIHNIPQRIGSSDLVTKPATKKEGAKTTAVIQPSGADLPGIATSKIDVNAKPIYEPAGKPITQIDIDTDLPENDKPWRRPGTDVSDYFNYGFDEFTWALYASKQESLRSEYSADKVALNQKKMFEDMNMMMAMGGMPGMMPGAAGGMENGMPPEMQAIMQQMMAQGGDPSQMDPSAMFAAMQGGQNSAGGAGSGQAGPGQGFGVQGGFGQGQNQYGYEQQGMNTNRGNFRGRGGRRGGW